MRDTDFSLSSQFHEAGDASVRAICFVPDRKESISTTENIKIESIRSGSDCPKMIAF